MEVVVADVTTHGISPNITILASFPASHPVQAMVTVSPPKPLVGVILAIEGVRVSSYV